MGTEPKGVPAMKQIAVSVLPTRTIYDFDDGHVHVTLTFMTPALPDDLDVLARPLTYLTWDVRSVDGADHAISIYDSTSALAGGQYARRRRSSGRARLVGDLTVLRAGTVDQTLLQPAGDDTRIDWGYVYVAAPASQAKAAIGSSDSTWSRASSSGGRSPTGTTTACRAPPTIASPAWRSPSTSVASAPSRSRGTS